MRSKKSQTPRPREITQWAMEKSKSKEKIELTKGIKQALALVKERGVREKAHPA